nr:hypothetical protein [Candidatus Protofrankia californiensis]
MALLAEAGLLTEQTTIVTTMHDLQVVEEELPEAEHDFRTDFVVTLEWVMACGRPKRPRGLSWESPSKEKIADTPVLAARAASQANAS